MNLIDGRVEENQDTTIFCKYDGVHYNSPWYANNAIWENDLFFFIEGCGSEAVRLATMLEF